MKRSRSLSTPCGRPFQHAIKAITILAVVSSMVGCTTIAVPLGNVTNSLQSYKDLTGNWEFQLVSTTSVTPFRTLAGYLDEVPESSTSVLLSAILQPSEPSSCYVGIGLVPLFGYVRQAQVGIYSFTNNGQYLNTSFTENTERTQLTGTYQVLGGCAGSQGAAGTLTGTRYAVLTGTYTGSLTENNLPSTVNLQLSQNSYGNGDGSSFVSGSASFQGISCFKQGTLSASSGYVLGSTFHLLFTTDEASGSQVMLAGTFNPTADILTINTGSVTGGNCAGPIGGASLTLHN